MPKLIIGLVGEIAAGKGSVSKYLEDKYGATSCRFSSVLRDILSRLYIDITRQNMQTLSSTLRPAYGQDVFAKAITNDAKTAKSNIVVVDGIRRFADIIYLKNLPEFVLVNITADIHTRYERIINRSENIDDRNKSFERFQKEHESEAETEIASVGATAKYTITNDGTIDKLHDQIEKILKIENKL